MLDQEIKKFTEELYEETFGNGQNTPDEFDWEDIASVIEDTAKHFAEWQKKLDDLETADLLAIAHLQGMEQQKAKMLEDAVEKYVHELYTDEEGYHGYISLGTEYAPGDKVRVIVIKED